MSVIVAGGGGYVGSHVCKALRAAGVTPVTIDNLSTGHAWAVKWGPFEQADVRDPAALDNIFERHKPEAIFHFCASSLVGASVEDPLSTYENNLLGTLRLLQAAQRHGVFCFIFSSTAAVYGQPERVPIEEAEGINPINPYGASKAACERILEDQARASGLRYAALRYFNAAGADSEAEAGELHQPETHLIPLAVRAALDPNFTLTIFGEDYDTTDGTPIRDYVHVADLAQAHLAAWTHIQSQNENLVLNLGCGLGRSVREVISAVEQATGVPPKTRIGARRFGDPPVLVANGEAAHRVLGWTPVWTDLNSVVESAVAWHRKMPFWQAS